MPDSERVFGSVPIAPKSGGNAQVWGHWSCYAMLVVVLAGALHARIGPTLVWPLEQDESVVVRSYGPVPYDVCFPEYAGTGRFDPFLLARGVGKCFVNHWDPANHYLCSLSVSFATFLLGASEATFRLPSLLVGIVLCLVLAAWGRLRSGSAVCGLLIGLVAAYHPYLVYYSQSCRGYIWTVALVFLQILLIDRLADRKGDLPLWTNLGMVLLGSVIFLNLISTAIMWLVPLYAAGVWWWQRPGQPLRGWRAWIRYVWCQTAYQQWLAQGILVGGCVLLFILLKLPDILLAQRKYGIPITNPAGQLPGAVGELVRMYGPGLWSGFLLVAAVGLVVATGTRRGWLWIGPVLLGAIVLTVLYSLAGHKLLYPRTYGVWLPAAFLLCAHLWRSADGYPKWARISVHAGMALGLAGGIAQGMIDAPGSHLDYRTAFYNDAANRFEKVFRGLSQEQRERLQLAMPYAWGESMKCYLATSREALEQAVVGKESFDLAVFCELHDGTPLARVQTLDRFRAENTFWVPPPSLATSPPLLAMGDIVALRFAAAPPRQEGPYLVAWQAGRSGFNAWEALLPTVRQDPLLADTSVAGDAPVRRLEDVPGCRLQKVGFLWGEGRLECEVLALAWDTSERVALEGLFARLCNTHGGKVQTWSLQVAAPNAGDQ